MRQAILTILLVLVAAAASAQQDSSATVQTNFAGIKPLTGIGPWPYISLVASEAWDFDATRRATQRPGAREANPLFAGDNAKMFIYKGAVTAVLVVIIRQLDISAQKTGSRRTRRAAKWLGYGIGMGNSAVAFHNEQVGR